MVVLSFLILASSAAFAAGESCQKDSDCGGKIETGAYCKDGISYKEMQIAYCLGLDENTTGYCSEKYPYEEMEICGKRGCSNGKCNPAPTGTVFYESFDGIDSIIANMGICYPYSEDIGTPNAHIHFCDAQNNIEFVPGVKGNAAKFESTYAIGENYNNALIYRGVSSMSDKNTATIEMWLKPENMKQSEDQIYLPTYFMEFYNKKKNVSFSVWLDFPVGTLSVPQNKSGWHKFDVTLNCDNKGEIILYVDDKKAKSVFDPLGCEMSMEWGQFSIHETGSEAFAIDELKLFDYVKTFEDIKKDYYSAFINLECPTGEVGPDYNFSWSSEEFSNFALQIGYNQQNQKSYFSIPAKSNPTAIEKYFKKIIATEKKALDKTLYAKLAFKSNTKTTAYSNTCEFKLKQPVAPVLKCPSEAIDSNYAFAWNANDYGKKIKLELSYENSFKKKTAITTTKTNPAPIKKYWKTLQSYKTKGTDGTLYARIFATDKYARTSYSNTCAFKAQ